MIAVITYDHPHRKTQDLIFQLKMRYHVVIHLVVIPWSDLKSFNPIYEHRPPLVNDISIAHFCERLDLTFTKVEVHKLNQYFNKNKFQSILIGGAGLLPPDLAANHKIINAHPGYLPNVKGLDALKWAIYEGQPIGVTTHFISEKTDEGEMIDRAIVPVYFEDTFHALAYRVYETEIKMLADAVRKVEIKQYSTIKLNDGWYSAYRRMPHNKEIMMMSIFDEIRKKSQSRS